MKTLHLVVHISLPLVCTYLFCTIVFVHVISHSLFNEGSNQLSWQDCYCRLTRKTSMFWCNLATLSFSFGWLSVSSNGREHSVHYFPAWHSVDTDYLQRVYFFDVPPWILFSALFPIDLLNHRSSRPHELTCFLHYLTKSVDLLYNKSFYYVPQSRS